MNDCWRGRRVCVNSARNAYPDLVVHFFFSSFFSIFPTIGVETIQTLKSKSQGIKKAAKWSSFPPSPPCSQERTVPPQHKKNLKIKLQHSNKANQMNTISPPPPKKKKIQKKTKKSTSLLSTLSVDCLYLAVPLSTEAFLIHFPKGWHQNKKRGQCPRFWGGRGGGSEIPENADILGVFFSSKIFFFTGVVHDFDQNL